MEQIVGRSRIAMLAAAFDCRSFNDWRRLCDSLDDVDTRYTRHCFRA